MLIRPRSMPRRCESGTASRASSGCSEADFNATAGGSSRCPHYRGSATLEQLGQGEPLSIPCRARLAGQHRPAWLEQGDVHPKGPAVPRFGESFCTQLAGGRRAAPAASQREPRSRLERSYWRQRRPTELDSAACRRALDT